MELQALLDRGVDDAAAFERLGAFLQSLTSAADLGPLLDAADAVIRGNALLPLLQARQQVEFDPLSLEPAAPRAALPGGVKPAVDATTMATMDDLFGSGSDEDSEAGDDGAAPAATPAATPDTAAAAAAATVCLDALVLAARSALAQAGWELIESPGGGRRPAYVNMATGTLRSSAPGLRDLDGGAWPAGGALSWSQQVHARIPTCSERFRTPPQPPVLISILIPSRVSLITGTPTTLHAHKHLITPHHTTTTPPPHHHHTTTAAFDRRSLPRCALRHCRR